ncbi:uncharacterized protein DUF2585 [Breoghania corrubedonensis]|uniref:UPF0314 protein C8N35_1011363 n=1 Tax=Breoghania corrubedonensis TaxID=665038 RepID=A0A2T5VHS8_9HYPH|nr:DUF2585 domain-containing protein [Breoghania corrubedonensis]PTW63312.1 uncharacterized protein DUF2585 [Breoghania corrubedonensis]
MTARNYWIAGIAIMAATAIILLAMGRIPICECGYVRLWSPPADLAGNSQHIADWYSPSHFIHGLLFYAALWLLLRSRPLGSRALIALVIEAAWEIVENSPWIIDRYREATIAVGYTGDSVLNSVCDILFMLIGFLFAARMPVWFSVAIAIVLELLALWVIRDNLTLNVIMLVHPVDAIRTWQAG